MARWLRIILPSLLFALMLVFAAGNAYQSLESLRSHPGWSIERRGDRLLITQTGMYVPSFLRIGDEIIALNGQEIKHIHQLDDGLLREDPGTRFNIVVRRESQLLDLTLETIPVPLSLLMLRFAATVMVPAVFLSVGIVLFLLKRDDGQALLLALTFALVNPPLDFVSVTGLPSWAAVLMMAGRTASSFVFPVFCHFFLVFPQSAGQRSPLLKRFPRLTWYLYIPHLLVILPYYVVDTFLKSVEGDRALVFEYSWRIPMNFVSLLYVAFSMVFQVINYRQAGELSRRKLRVVLAGGIAGGAPVLLLLGLFVLYDTSRIDQELWWWFNVVAMVALLLVPLSFAYAIVRHQVIPVSLIIRRGVRYLLVSRGSVVLELITVLLALTLLLSLFFSYLQTSNRFAIGVVSAVVALAVWKLANGLHRRVIAPLIDRRFFRQSYNAQQILSELGDALRLIPSVQEMTSLVSARIQAALQTESVAIFLRNDATGDFDCAISSFHEGDNGNEADSRRHLGLPRGAVTVERLCEQSQPLEVDLQDQTFLNHANHVESGVVQSCEAQTLSAVRSALLLPVATKDQMLGVVSLGLRLGDIPFSGEDKQLLMAVAFQMAFAIENAHLIERKAEEQRLRGELAMAAEVQRRLFPSRPPDSAELELAGFCLPARGVGGDYYDFLKLRNGSIGIAIADVAGKGMSAALLMSTVQATLRSQALAAGRDLTDLVSSMNRLLYDSTDTCSYATFFYAEFDESTRELTYVNAGHNPPIMVRTSVAVGVSGFALQDLAERHRGGTGEHVAESGVAANKPVSLLTLGGPVIGVLECCNYEQGKVQLRSGDLIVAYTDGVTEALNPDGLEFGETRLQQIIIASPDLSADELMREIVDSVSEWCRGAPQHDDLTLVVLRVK